MPRRYIVVGCTWALVLSAGLWLAFQPISYAAPRLQGTPIPVTLLPEEATIEIGDGFPDPIRSGKFWVNLTSNDGYERRYIVHIPPAYSGESPVPLLLSFHGFTSSAALNAQYTRLDVKADEEGFIVAYPEGLGDPPGWYQYQAGVDWADDVQFARDVVADLQVKLNIDVARIYATGFSNGGEMAYHVACGMADVVAAAAPVGGVYLENDTCNPARPIPIMTIHGMADAVNPYEGLPGLFMSIPDWTARWVKRNGCQAEPAEDTTRTTFGTTIFIEAYTNCTDGADVTLYSFEGMDHVWPSQRAPEFIWDFMAAHPMPQRYIDTPPVAAAIDESDDTSQRNPARLDVPGGDYVAQVPTGGNLRDYFIHIPESYTPSSPTPLVISFHGIGSNPPLNARNTGLSTLSDEAGFIAVYPGGSGDPLRFNHLGDVPPGAPNDVQMTRNLITSLQNLYNIDPDRIYVTGMSNGGGMAHRVGCSLSDVVAAVAPVAGGILIGDPCTPDQPVSVLMLHGDADTVVPYRGDSNVFGTIVTAEFWAERNACSGDPILEEGAAISVMRWDSCGNDTTVELHTYHGNGHVWPDGGAAAVWEFFQNHPRQHD